MESRGFAISGPSTYVPNSPVTITVGTGVFCGVLMYAEVIRILTQHAKQF